jgi:putative integral membrane protein (TIGR02587 family)
MDQRVVKGFGRAFAGALIFALPMLMTMELWSIGFYIAPLKLALLLALTVPLLVGLSWLRGFEPTDTWDEDLLDAFIALAVGAIASVVTLYVFGLISYDASVREIIGKVAVQTVPASMGASLARSQLGGDSGKPAGERNLSYPAILFMMTAGALFLGLNVAPTEEVITLAYAMDAWRLIALVVVSLAVMHAFVYVVGFHNTPDLLPGSTFAGRFVQFTLVGYAIVLLLSLYLLWTFGRTDATSIAATLNACIVLGFPSALGAAASRLIL